MSNVHNLKHNGAPYTEAGELLHSDTSVTSGTGAALCTCGTLSEQLDSGAARRRWHKNHKEQAAASAPVQGTIETVLGQDVLAGTPEGEVAEALAELEAEDLLGVPAKPKAKRAPKAKEPRVTRAMARSELLDSRKAKAAAPAEPADGYAEYSKTVAMDKGIKPGFWRSLGRDAAVAVVDNAYPMVKAEPDNAGFKLTFTGPQDHVTEAVAAVKQLWHDALAATKDWKATDAKFLGRSEEPLERRREGYHLTEDFYRSFGTTHAAELFDQLHGK